MASAPFPLADRLRRIHCQIENAALAREGLEMADAVAAVTDRLTDHYIDAMDRVFAELDAMRRSGELAGIETLIRRQG
ncbi:hypothetical protein [Albidovulum sp.]|uniref:hypothetical protein n=1 Tax=Albidovulum sp. TaxID=1872424 RepID=UPI0039B903A1